MSARWTNQDTIGVHLLAALFTSFFAIVVLRSAWVHDDAYITFRTVDNFINGYGLRWNPAERVQTYTHPLWMLLVSAFYFVTHEAFYTVVVLSILLSIVTALLVLFGAAKSLAAGVLGVGVLTLSKAFVDYSTSGLENPLTHFLLASFLVVYFQPQRTLKMLYLLSSIAALAAVNRMDTVLLFLPVLAAVLIEMKSVRGIAAVAVGFIPFAIWEIFSLSYYGFLFPNTAYAKLIGPAVGRTDLARHGLYYLQNSVRLDPLTLLTIGSAIAVGVLAKERRVLPVAGGIGAYLLYVVLIGGDFVTGRFLTAPLLGAVMLLTRWHPSSRTAMPAAAVVILVIGFGSAQPPPLSTSAEGSQGRALMDSHGIADERAYYYPYAGFLRALQGVTVASHPWAIEGQQARHKHLPLTVRGDIGFFGYYAGPQVHIVDPWALADPLLARLPARSDLPWRVGHFTRAVPDGYLETLASGENRIADKNLAAYYDKLSVITRGPVFDLRRWFEIWKMNTGQYDHLLSDAARRSQPPGRNPNSSM